jgi:hypothetical protein
MWATLLVVAVALVGCGADAIETTGADSSGDPQVDESLSPVPVDPDKPCSLLTEDDVAQAVGLPVTGKREVESMPTGHGTVPLCLYSMPEPFASVVIEVKYPVSPGSFAKDQGRDPNNTDRVEGGAFIHGCATLSALVNRTQVNITVQHFDSCAQSDAALTAVERIAGEKLAGNTVVVPQVAGMSLADGCETLAAAGLRAGIKGESSPCSGEAAVVSQEPEAGADIPAGSEVVLSISPSKSLPPTP